MTKTKRKKALAKQLRRKQEKKRRAPQLLANNSPTTSTNCSSDVRRSKRIAHQRTASARAVKRAKSRRSPKMAQVIQRTFGPDPPLALPGWQYSMKEEFRVGLNQILQKRLRFPDSSYASTGQAVYLLKEADKQALVYEGLSKQRIEFLVENLIAHDGGGNARYRKRKVLIRILEKYDWERTFARFTQLPSDARKRVYEFHFEDLRSGLRAHNHPSPPPFAQTCRHVRAECLQVFWTTQVFHLTSLPSVNSMMPPDLSGTDKKWLQKVVGNHLPRLRKFIISCLPTPNSTIAPLVQICFDRRLEKVIAEHLGTWAAKLDMPYGIVRSKRASAEDRGYVQDNVSLFGRDQGLVMSEGLLKALVDRVDALRYGYPANVTVRQDSPMTEDSSVRPREFSVISDDSSVKQETDPEIKQEDGSQTAPWTVV